VFERFTEEARIVVVEAQAEARELRHPHLGTEHLLLGLMRIPSGCVAADVLAALDLNGDNVRARLLELAPSGEEPASGQMAFTPRSRRVLEVALREALRRGDRDVGAEHILLAIARDDQDAMSLRLLREFQIAPDRLRAAVLRALPAPNPEHVEVPRRSRHVAVPLPSIGVDLSADADRLLMSAAARALDDGRTLITVSDIEAALRRRGDADDQPPQSATG